MHLQICFPPLIKFLYDNKVWLAFVPEDGNNLHNLLIVSQTKKKYAFVSILNCDSMFFFYQEQYLSNAILRLLFPAMVLFLRKVSSR